MNNFFKTSMLKAILFSLVLLLMGCTDSCENAKSRVAKYMKQYLNAIYKGANGASVPGGAEAIQALEIAKIKCNKPDLTIENITEEYSKNDPLYFLK